MRLLFDRAIWWSGDELAYSVNSLRIAYSRTEDPPPPYGRILGRLRNVLSINVMRLWRSRWAFSGVRKRLFHGAGKPVWEHGKVRSGMLKELFRDKLMPKKDNGHYEKAR